MATESSFDVVSKVDMQEVKNAIDQAEKEIEARFDFKGSISTIELDEKESLVKLASDNETRMNALIDVLQSKFMKRGVDIRSLEIGKLEEATKGTVRQEVKIKQGLDADTTRKVVKLIKDSGLKVQTQQQGEQVRVSGKSRDDLQTIMQKLKAAELEVALQFVNYR